MVLILMLRANPGANRNSLWLDVVFRNPIQPGLNQALAVSFCLSMIFSEKPGFRLFRIVLWWLRVLDGCSRARNQRPAQNLLILWLIKDF
jgi:hypothetical protein